MKKTEGTAQRKQKSDTFPSLLIVLVGLAYFVLMFFPNFAGSKDLGMVMIFEPDEGVPLPYVFDMIKPADSVKQGLVNFVDYNYYFYGYPYFAYSALSLIPVKFLAGLDQVPWVMVVLRQIVSLLPVIAAIFLMVRMYHIPGRRWAAPVLLIFLLAVPGVIRNNFWWHPDGMVVLASVLTLFFLNRDNFDYGKYFYLAALFCGFSTGIKYTGVFFVLTIAVYLVWGLIRKKSTVKKLILAGLGFVAVMSGGFLISNPLLIFYPSVRQGYLEVFLHEAYLLSTGYNIIYPKGLRSSLPIISDYYGHLVFLGIVLLAPILGIIRGNRRLLNVLVITWAIPLTIYSLTGAMMKFQYILPVIIPLFASLTEYIPEGRSDQADLDQNKPGKKWAALLSAGALIIVAVQFVSFLITDTQLYRDRLFREELSPSVSFYSQVSPHLGPLMDRRLYVYHDVRLYVPDESPWNTISIFKLLDYDFLEQENPAILLLMQQRIRDYLNQDVEGVDPEKLESARVFYRDADREEIEGYLLVFRNDFGLAFVRQDVYEKNLIP